MTEIKPFPLPAVFFKRMKENILSYDAEADTDSSVLQNYIRDSRIPLRSLAHGLSLTEDEIANFAAGSGRKPTTEQRVTMKYIISNYLAGVITPR